MRCRTDVMGAREAPCLGAPFGEVHGVSRGDSSAPWRWDLYLPYPRADVMGLSSAVKVRLGGCRQPWRWDGVPPVSPRRWDGGCTPELSRRLACALGMMYWMVFFNIYLESCRVIGVSPSSAVASVQGHVHRARCLGFVPWSPFFFWSCSNTGDQIKSTVNGFSLSFIGGYMKFLTESQPCASHRCLVFLKEIVVGDVDIEQVNWAWLSTRCRRLGLCDPQLPNSGGVLRWNRLDTTRSYHWLGCRCCALDKLNGPCESAGKRDANVLHGDGPLVLFVGLLATAGPDPTRVEAESFPHFETASWGETAWTLRSKSRNLTSR